ncbi:Uncharacterized protein FKW44_015280, partial [Caligus rogercresseyi]
MSSVSFREESEAVANAHLKRFYIPEESKSRICASLTGIYDDKKFMAELQISAYCISFDSHCLNCGKLYNDVEHAFVDCPL